MIRPCSKLNSHIDAVAQRGMHFDHYYCGSSPCQPSRTGWSSGGFGIRAGGCADLLPEDGSYHMAQTNEYPWAPHHRVRQIAPGDVRWTQGF